MCQNYSKNELYRQKTKSWLFFKMKIIYYEKINIFEKGCHSKECIELIDNKIKEENINIIDD